MKQFTSHIDYLIQKHDCVIIPDFGGFVLSRQAASITSDGAIAPPKVVVGFNPDLKYNDGLLAESYMNVYSISYDVACKRIKDAVNRLDTILALRQPVQIGNLGKLSLDGDNHLCFTPNVNVSLHYPDTFGLSQIEIKRLADIQEVQNVAIVVNRKKTTYQRIFTGIGAAAAAVLVFFVTSTPVFDNADSTIQKSGFFTDVLAASSQPSVSKPVVNVEVSETIDGRANEIDTKTEAVVEEATVVAIPEKEPIKQLPVSEPVKNIVKETKKTPTAKYYVIIGSAGNKSEAQTVLKKFKAQGFQNANIVNSAERSRIYIASFEDKGQAEKYLSKFKNSNPKLSDAWVYTKRN